MIVPMFIVAVTIPSMHMPFFGEPCAVSVNMSFVGDFELHLELVRLRNIVGGFKKALSRRKSNRCRRPSHGWFRS